MKNEKYFSVLASQGSRIKLMLFFIFLFSSFILFTSCEKEKPTKVAPAFYHWQTELKLTPAERQLMDSLNAKKLYVKYFDIDLDGNNNPVPHAVVEINPVLLSGMEIIPTIFITNRTFKNISKKNIEKLADNIFQKINELNIRPSKEIQFDCDWTKTTRENYFYFLERFKSLSLTLSPSRPLTLSATIRLHQLKYPDQTGVPPVNKGILMFYNMGDLEDWETENSILDLSTAEKYLPSRQSAVRSRQYPFPLDFALPIFKWGVVFRNSELVYLINNLEEKEISDMSRFYEINKNRYAVKNSTYLNGYYLYEGDLIRLEKISSELLNDASVLLNNRFAKFQKFNKHEEPIISFYHLDTTTLADFRYEDFEKVLKCF